MHHAPVTQNRVAISTLAVHSLHGYVYLLCCVFRSAFICICWKTLQTCSHLHSYLRFHLHSDLQVWADYQNLDAFSLKRIHISNDSKDFYFKHKPKNVCCLLYVVKILCFVPLNVYFCPWFALFAASENPHFYRFIPESVFDWLIDRLVCVCWV